MTTNTQDENDAIRLTVANFLNRPNIWRIPVYQRHYSWAIKEHGPVMQFWKSVCEQVEGRRDGEQPNAHYLGALLVERKGEDRSGMAQYDVVDGQQRITTIQLALCALVWVAKEQGIEEDVKDVFGLISCGDGEIHDPKLRPANFDERQFRSVFYDVFKKMSNLDLPKNQENYEKSNVYETFCFFQEKIGKMLESLNKAEKINTVQALKESLLYGFDVVLIILKKEDEAQKIFESMNNTAQPLTTFDLIRNDVFYRASEQDIDEEELFKSDEWQEFEEPFWGESSKKRPAKSSEKKPAKHNISSSASPYIDDYIARMLSAELGEVAIFKRQDLFKKYQTFGEEFGDARRELTTISEYIGIYKYLVRKNDNVPGGVACSFFREWTDKALYSLLFVIISSDTDEKERMVKLLENYVVRRALCGFTEKGYNKFAPEILKKGNQVSYEKLHQFLCSQEVDTNVFPTDKTLKDKIPYAKFYNDKHKIQNYILSEIENKLRTNQDENIEFDDLTLDHVMPQTRNSTDCWTSNEEEKIAEDYIHTIGNITLLTRAKNASKKNYSFEKIREKLRSSSLIMNQKIAEQEKWNIDSIKNRSEEMATYICARWPYDVPS